MDKLSVLENNLENIINSLDKEISSLEEEYEDNAYKVEDLTREKESLENDLNELKRELNFLKAFEHKNIFLTTIKKIWIFFWQEFKNEAVPSKIFCTMLMTAILLASIALPLYGAIVIGLIAALNLYFSLYMVLKVKKTGIKESIERLEQEEKDIQEKVTSIKEKINELNIKIVEILANKADLSSEKNGYNNDLEKAKEARTSSVDVSLDDSLSMEFRDIAKRVRQRKLDSNE